MFLKRPTIFFPFWYFDEKLHHEIAKKLTKKGYRCERPTITGKGETPFTIEDLKKHDFYVIPWSDRVAQQGILGMHKEIIQIFDLIATEKRPKKILWLGASVYYSLPKFDPKYEDHIDTDFKTISSWETIFVWFEKNYPIKLDFLQIYFVISALFFLGAYWLFRLHSGPIINVILIGFVAACGVFILGFISTILQDGNPFKRADSKAEKQFASQKTNSPLIEENEALKRQIKKLEEAELPVSDPELTEQGKDPDSSESSEEPSIDQSPKIENEVTAIHSRTASYIKVEEKINSEMGLKTEESAPSPDTLEKTLLSKKSIFLETLQDSLERIKTESERAHEKSTALLTYGIWTGIGGVVGYLVAISLWQLLAGEDGIHARHYVGMASTSFLFLFIEFLAAWFLKQYRYFVDTATFYTKLLTMEERALLTYLNISERTEGHGNELETKHWKPLTDLLQPQIQWPETANLKAVDKSFAAEHMQALSAVTKEVAGLVKAAKPPVAKEGEE